MFSKLLCLIALYPLVCSAKYLENFSEIPELFEQVNFSLEGHIHSSSVFTHGVDEYTATEQCAGKCFSVDFFCQAFLLVDTKFGNDDVLLCTLLNRAPVQFPQIEAEQMGQEVYNKTLAAFKIHTSQFEDIIARFSPDNISEKERAEKILDRYWVDDLNGPRNPPKLWDSNMAFLTVCNAAMYEKQPRALNFEKWLSGDDILASQRAPWELEKFSQHKMNWLLKYWAAAAPPFSKDDLQKDLDFIVLSFLALFSRKFRPDISALYDPIEKLLFIKGENLHLFISSVDSGHYIIVLDQHARSHQPDVPIIYSTFEISHEHCTNIMEMFKQGMHRFHPEYEYLVPWLINLGPRYVNHLEKELRVISFVVSLLNRLSKHPTLDSVFRITDLVVARDAVTAVLFNAHRETLTRLQSNAFKRLESKLDIIEPKLNTVDIIIQY